MSVSYIQSKNSADNPWESVLGFVISILQGGLADQIMGGDELLCLLSPQDGSVEEIS